MAEDTAILFVSRRVGADFAEFEVIDRIGRLQDHDAVLGIKLFLNRLQGFRGKAFFDADACQHAESLRFNEDLSFFTFMRTDFIALSIIGS